MRDHNICFSGELKIIFELSSIPPLIWSSGSNFYFIFCLLLLGSTLTLFVQEHELQTKENSLNTDALKQEIADMAKEKSELEGKISELR